MHINTEDFNLDVRLADLVVGSHVSKAGKMVVVDNVSTSVTPYGAAGSAKGRAVLPGGDIVDIEWDYSYHTCLWQVTRMSSGRSASFDPLDHPPVPAQNADPMAAENAPGKPVCICFGFSSRKCPQHGNN